MPGKTNRSISFFFAALLFCGFVANSQSLKSLLKQGEEAMKDKDYFTAAQVYYQIMLRDSSNMDYQYKYATASRLNFDNDIALRYYQKVFKVDNAKLYPETTFWIGELLKTAGRYKEAKKMLNKFASKNRRNKNTELRLMAEKAFIESESCDLAQILIKNPLTVKIEHLDTNVNSKVSEYAPFEYDTVLIFSSLRYSGDRDKKNNINYNKLYLSNQKENKWQRARELDTLFNKDGIHTANTCFNKDLTRMYLARCTQVNTSTFTCKIYMSEKKNNAWTNPAELPAPINIPGTNNTQPATGVINGEEYLFFSSNRGGGVGGMDIWYAKMKEDGSFENPINAGKLVNSREDEITPHYISKTNTLFFSSTWHKGLGSFDIFKSEYKDGGFKEPENAGYPINSPLNDIYYSLSSKKNKVFLSSNRAGSYFEEKQSCCNDIYAFSIPSLEDPPPPVDTSVNIINQMKVLVPLTLFFHNDEPDPKTRAVITKKNYKTTYDAYAPMRNQYVKEYTAGLQGEEKEIAVNRVLNFFEDSVDAGMQDLERFAQLLEQVLARGEHVKVTNKGYCSPLASTDYNINLAKRRVYSLESYFKEYKNGVFLKYLANRDSTNGMGILEFFEEDIGELPKSTVSDDVKDTRNSVYSPFAAAERKIQIIAVSLIDNNTRKKKERP